MKYIITIFLLNIGVMSIGQVAIIDDEDGYTIVRSNPDSNSEAIYKLSDNEVFWFGQEDYYSENLNWVPVSISKNNYSLECGALDIYLALYTRVKSKFLVK